MPMPSWKRQRLGNRVVVGGRVRADLLELADVVRPWRRCRRQRPQRRRCSRGARRGSPCRSARAATCAGSCRSSRSRGRSALYGKCANACAPSTIVLTPRRRASSQICFTGKIWPGQVGDVAEVQDFGRRRDRADQPIGEIVHRWRRHGERDLRQLDAVAADALFPGVEHPPVILVGRDDLVARLEVDAELRDLQRLARVARDGELFGIAAELRREPAAHALDVRLEDLPHVVHGRLVRDVEIALQRLVDDARARAAAAVVEIDDRAVERERLLDLAPVGLVGGDARGRLRRDAPAGRAACARARRR